MNRPSICRSCGKLMGIAEECPYCGAKKNSATGYIKMAMRAAERDDTGSLVTKYILYFTIFVYVVQVFMGMFTQGSGAMLSLIWSGAPVHVSWVLGASTKEIYLYGHWFRLINPNFLHGSLLHILFNMYALKQIGPLIERAVGPFWFLPSYILCGMGGFWASSFFGTPISVGASASIFGLIGMGMVMAYMLGGGRSDPMFQILMQWAIFSFVLGFIIPNIDNWAHFGGLAVGAAIGYIWSKYRRTLAYSPFAKFLCAVSIIAVIASFSTGVYFLFPEWYECVQLGQCQ